MIFLVHIGVDEIELAANCVKLPAAGFSHIDGQLQHPTARHIHKYLRIPN